MKGMAIWFMLWNVHEKFDKLNKYFSFLVSDARDKDKNNKYKSQFKGEEKNTLLFFGYTVYGKKDRNFLVMAEPPIKKNFSSLNNINRINNENFIFQGSLCKKSSINKLSNLYSSEVISFIKEKNLNPVFIYDDLSNGTTGDIIKKKVLEDTRNLSGIYLILNKATNDYYIGSASTNKFYARFSNHLYNFNGSKLVKHAVKKYKISSFSFLILELFGADGKEIVNKENNKNLLDLEDFYLKSLLPNYNILTEAGSSFGYKHTEITRLNMKANYSEERRKAIGNLNRGKTLSENTIELIRQKSLKRIKQVYSEKALQNMKKSSKAIRLYNLDYTVYGEYPSMIEASKNIGCDKKTIRRALQSEKKILKRRWIVKYL